MNKTLLTLAALTLSTGMALADTKPSIWDPSTGMVVPVDQIDFANTDAADMVAMLAEMRAMGAEHRQEAQAMMQQHMQEMTPEARAELQAAMQQEMQAMQQNGTMSGGNMGNMGGNGGGMGGNGMGGNN